MFEPHNKTIQKNKFEPQNTTIQKNKFRIAQKKKKNTKPCTHLFIKTRKVKLIHL